MSSSFKNRLCRLCLGGYGIRVNIFDEKINLGFIVEDLIDDLLKHKVVREIEYPWLICSSCLSQLNDFRAFKERCIESIYVFENREDNSDSTENGDLTQYVTPPKIEFSHSPDDDSTDGSTLGCATYGTSGEGGTCESIWTGSGPPDTIIPSNISLKQEIGSPFHHEDSSVDNVDLHCAGETESQEYEINYLPEDVNNSSTVEYKREDSNGEINDCLRRLCRMDGGNGQSSLYRHKGEEGARERGEQERYSSEIIKREVIESESLESSVPGCATGPELMSAGGKTYNCENCPASFMMQDKLKEHMVVHTNGKSNTCRELEKGFHFKSLLQSHDIIHRCVRTYSCNVCPKTYPEILQLKMHMTTHTDKAPFSCNVSSAMTAIKSNLESQLRTQTREKPYKCNICSTAFTWKGNLEMHLRIHTGEKPNKCNVCSAAFTQKGALVRHLQTHTGEKPYKCNVCSTAFTRKGHLERHLQAHTGEKPYKCNVCSVAFKQKGALVRHLRMHTGEKPFKCNLCSMAFTRKSNLDRHLQTHTSGGRNEISHRSASFLTGVSLYRAA